MERFTALALSLLMVTVSVTSFLNVQSPPYEGQKYLIISIDAGTTSNRAILFDLKGKPVFSSQKEFTQYFPKSGWVEHNPEEIWNSTKKVLKDVILKAKKLRGKVLAIASGAAALNPKLAKIFAGAGVNIQEGYGLTETSPVLTVNLPTNHGHVLGTVGTPLKGVELKLDNDGEILAKGPNVMMGYYGRPDLTAEVMTEDGWFRTGDIGEILDGGYLRITDRKKEIFKTSGGKYIAPQNMENVFKESPFIEQCMVAGENEKFPVLLVQANFEFLKKWCERKNIDYTTDEKIIQNKMVIDRIQKEIDLKNEDFAKWEQVKKTYLSPDPWTIPAGHLTPTMKLRRKPILSMYSKGYESLFKN